MGAIYRLGLIIAGCCFESAVRNGTQLGLYWIGRQDALQGFLPYLLPVFFGYVFVLDVKRHWSHSRLKNDVMAYVGSTLLLGYPLLIALSLWFAGMQVDPTTRRIRIVATSLFFVNLAIAVRVWLGAIRRGVPLSVPWGGVGGLRSGAALREAEGAVGDEPVVDEPAGDEFAGDEPAGEGPPDDEPIEGRDGVANPVEEAEPNAPAKRPEA